jgi:osmoprotectant transport system substrate-binding protein
MKLSILSAVAAAVMATIAFKPAAAADPIKVGSKNFTEQYILAEMYAALLEHAGFEVERKINLGGTLIAHQALTTPSLNAARAAISKASADESTS